MNRYGNVLRAVGVRAGEKVLWVGQNSAEVVAVNHAARKVGAVCVPMNYRLAPDEAQYVIDNCDAVVVLFDVEQVAQLEPIRGAVRPGAGVVRLPVPGHAAPAWARDLDAEAAAASADEPGPGGRGPHRRHDDDLHVGHHGEAEGHGAAHDHQRRRHRRPSSSWWAGSPTTCTCPPGRSTTRPRSGFMLVVQALGGSVVVQRHFDPEGWLRLVRRTR